MIPFLVSRLAQSLAVLAVMSFVVYALIGLMPGDPLDIQLSMDPRLTTEDIARLKALAGLDRPLIARYGDWLAGLLSGELGYSRLFNRPVAEAIWEAFGRTLHILAPAFVLSVVLALPISIGAAMRPYSARDYLVN
ncbi:MAG: ABC transporter permease, partial [Rhodospirillales bacterium]